MNRLVAIAILASSSLAAAQPGQTPPIAVPVAPAAPPQGIPEERSETTALALSLSGTAISYGLVGLALLAEPSEVGGTLGSIGLFGTLIAPSVGHVYADKFLTRGLALRLGGGLVALVGLLADNEGCGLFVGGHDVVEPDDCDETFRTTGGTVIILAGLAMWVGGTVDDIVQAPRRVRRLNDARRAALVALPVIHQDGGGIAISGRF